MIDKLYSELVESITSELKKQHSGEQWFSAPVAPTSKEKYYKQLLIFYKDAELSGNVALDNWFKDVKVYALKYLEDGYDDLGHFDEFYHISTTYMAVLKDGKLSLLNCVKNKLTEVASVSSITKEMRTRLRVDSASIARGTMSLESSSSDLTNAKPIGKLKGYILYQKGQKCALYTKDEKLILPFQTGLKVGWIEDKMISTETNSGYVLYTLEGKEIVKSSTVFDKFLDHKMAIVIDSIRHSWNNTEIKSVKFYDLNGYAGTINKIPNLLEIDFRRGESPSSLNLGCDGHGRLCIKILNGFIEVVEPHSLGFISDSNTKLASALSGQNYKAIFDSIFNS